jgi:hypothetical protein
MLFFNDIIRRFSRLKFDTAGKERQYFSGRFVIVHSYSQVFFHRHFVFDSLTIDRWLKKTSQRGKVGLCYDVSGYF